MSLQKLRRQIEQSLESTSFTSPCDNEAWLPTLLEVGCKTINQCAAMFHSTDSAFSDAIIRSAVYLVMKDRYGAELMRNIDILIRYSLICWSNGEHFDRDCIDRLRYLNLTSIYYDLVMSSISSAASTYIAGLCNGKFDTTFSAEISNWVENKLIPFCRLLFPNEIFISKSVPVSLSRLAKVTYVDVRAQELFDIIADFPDSTEALRELHVVATDVDMMARVGKTLRRILKRRLLHIGAATNQVIEMYVTIIRSLRILDPSNLLLNFVAQPVRKYLVDRSDTVRCIVSSITDGKDLHSELRVGGTLEYGLDSDDEGDAPDERWYPAKRGPELPNSGGKERDILAILVSIYGSTDMFVAEYRSILADKLLQNLQYSSDQEVATLELLKIRFLSLRCILLHLLFQIWRRSFT